ncbi:MAG: RibD family protein [Hyphomonadaceae bacterium]|nr:RibD family protein [Hyphomonadaceae bacterium]
MIRPRVTLKLATSLDGRIATASGESKWITSAEARAEGHKLRSQHDAVLVGIATVLADDPLLTDRTDPPPPKQPLRVVLDSSFRLPPTSRLAQTAQAHPVVVFGAMTPPPPLPHVRSVELDPARVEAVLDYLKQAHAVASVLIEGGGRVAASFLRAGLVDRIEWFRASIVLGAEGAPGIGALLLQALQDAPRFERLAVRPIGPDLWESYGKA